MISTGLSMALACPSMARQGQSFKLGHRARTGVHQDVQRGLQGEYAALHEKYLALKEQRVTEVETLVSEQTKQVRRPDS